MDDFISLEKAGKTETLKEFGPWPETKHLFSSDDLRAINMAYMANRGDSTTKARRRSGRWRAFGWGPRR